MGNREQAKKEEISHSPAVHFPIDYEDSLCDDGFMTYPRSHLVSEEEPGFYHVGSRCVRRAFLCGQDRVTGRCFEHRRAWIEDRILELADAFAVSVYFYAVMSNYFHVVLYVDPTFSATWSDDEVARVWLMACPGELKRNPSEELTQCLETAILSDPERVQELRKRLGSLSWSRSLLITLRGARFNQRSRRSREPCR